MSDGTRGSPSKVSKSEVVDRLCQEYFEWRLQDNPEFATERGFHQYDDQLESYSLDALATRKEKVDHFLARAQAISREGLPSASVISLKVLVFCLSAMADDYEWRFYGNLNPITFIEGRQTHAESEYACIPFDRVQDFDHYIHRLDKRPGQLDQIIGCFKKAIELKRTLHRVSIEPMIGQIGKLLVATPEESVFYHPFLANLPALNIPDQLKESLRARGKASVMGYVRAYAKLQQFLTGTYLQHTRERPGIDSWDRGEDLYRQCLRWHLTYDLEPEEVYEKGLAEVERISHRMKEIMTRQKFQGTLEESFDSLRHDPRFHTNSAEALLRRYKEQVDLVYPKLPLLFRNVPAKRPKVAMMPYDGPLGEHVPGSRDGQKESTFYVNLHHPETKNMFSMMSLTLHEAVPGHHLQDEYAFVTSLPDFRSNVLDRYNTVPYNFPTFCAFSEGWALYAESLGEELGLYKDDFELLGKYGQEMLRACRLVVDTGLHSRGWTREQAIQYMVERCPDAHKEIETEVDRYITWPGQACAYKIGELRIQELRRKAEKALGAKFDIREFHWVVLINGYIPLEMLDSIVRDWVASQGGDMSDMPSASYSTASLFSRKSHKSISGAAAQ